MAISGYTSRGKVDAGWWMEQIRAGVEFRKKYSYEASWDKWRRAYRGNWGRDILPVNVSFSMLRATIPRVYFNNPSVSVSPGQPGPINMAFAMIVNRIDGKLMGRMGVKKEIKKIVQNAYMFGSGFSKIGYGSSLQSADSSNIMGSGSPEKSSGGLVEKFEYDPHVNEGEPWFRSIHPKDLIVPAGASNWRDCRWVAEWSRRPLTDVQNDPRLMNTRNLVGTSIQGPDELSVSDPFPNSPISMVDLVEIRDAKTGQVFLLAPYSDTQGSTLLQQDDYFLELNTGFNYFPVQFNPDDEFFWCISDMKILEPMQLELNEINTQLMKHRRTLYAKILAKEGVLSDDKIELLQSEDVQAVIKVAGELSDVTYLSHDINILTMLMSNKNDVMSSIRETLGFSRNQLGDFQSRRGDTSATEAAIVQEGSEVRIDERRQDVADMLVGAVNMINETIFDFWQGDQLVELVGPGGADIWVKFNPSALNLGRYVAKVDPDSSAPQTREVRESKALQVYSVLKENPLIDPVKLTQYLLTEIEGVQLDALMAAIPAPESGVGGAPGNALNVGEFASLLTNQVGAAQGGAAPRGPGVPPELQAITG